MSEDDPQTEDEDDGKESRDQESEDEDDQSECQTGGSAPGDRESEGTHNSIPRLEDDSEEEDDGYHADKQQTDAQRDYESMRGNDTEFFEHQKNYQAHDQAEIPTKYCSLNDWEFKDQRLLQKLQQAIHDDNHNTPFGMLGNSPTTHLKNRSHSLHDMPNYFSDAVNTLSLSQSSTQHCCTSSFHRRRHHETLWDAVISGFFASMVQCMPCRVE